MNVSILCISGYAFPFSHSNRILLLCVCLLVYQTVILRVFNWQIQRIQSVVGLLFTFSKKRSRKRWLPCGNYSFHVSYSALLLDLPLNRLSGCAGCLLPPANEVWGKVIFWHLFVILFTGGECLTPPWPGADTPQGPGADTPPDLEQTPPTWTRCTPWDQVHPPESRHPPGPGAPPRSRQPPRTRCTPPQEQPPPPPWDQVHPLPEQTHPPPPTQSMLGDMVNTQVVRILLECNLVQSFQFQCSVCPCQLHWLILCPDWLLGCDIMWFQDDKDDWNDIPNKVGDAASTFENSFKRTEKSTVHRSTFIEEQQKLQIHFRHS